jgi:hypothetical protein
MAFLPTVLHYLCQMDLNQALLCEMQYWGSVSWHYLLSRSNDITFDLHEHYRKGSYRNRCHVMGPNGMLILSVPLIKGKFQHSAFGAVKISYAENWRKDHWMSLVSSYRRSAYFEYYEDDIAPLYKEQHEYLWQLNEATLKIVSKLLKRDLAFSYSDKYIGGDDLGGVDARSLVHPNPGKQKLQLALPEYPQVFMDRMSFLADLSLLDLLFNLGPRASAYLESVQISEGTL